MQLSELAEATGVSTASIKYYRREGLLPPGRHITATRQDYDLRHRERLQLIQVLREMTAAPIPRIRRLTAILDDPEQPLIAALADAQLLTLGPDDRPADHGPEHPGVARLIAHLGWPDIDSGPRRALDDLMRTLESWGMPTDDELLRRYAEPMAMIARADVSRIREPPGPEETPSPDVIVLRSVAGTVAYDRLVRTLRALGHTSLSVQDAGRSAPPSR